MRDVFNVFFGFGDRRDKKVYNLVNSTESFSNASSPYSPTTTAVNDRKEANPHSQSLSAIAVIDRILFKGKLLQGENKLKCKYRSNVNNSFYPQQCLQIALQITSANHRTFHHRHGREHVQIKITIREQKDSAWQCRVYRVTQIGEVLIVFGCINEEKKASFGIEWYFSAHPKPIRALIPVSLFRSNVFFAAHRASAEFEVFSR